MKTQAQTAIEIIRREFPNGANCHRVEGFSRLNELAQIWRGFPVFSFDGPAICDEWMAHVWYFSDGSTIAAPNGTASFLFEGGICLGEALSWERFTNEDGSQSEPFIAFS